MGYFAYAQYDVLCLHVILNAVKNPTEEPTRCILYSLWSLDISLALNMTFVWLPPSGEVSATPTIGDKFFGKPPSREIASLRSQRQIIKWPIMRTNKIKICRILFQGDRHACARDDTEIQPFGKPPSREIASLRSQRQCNG